MKFCIAVALFLMSASGFVSAQSIQPADSLGSKRSSWNIYLGSSVGANSGGATWFNTYIAPQYYYTLNSKWSVGGGAVISNTQITSPLYYSGEQSSQKMALNFSQSTLFAFGTYRPSDRLTLNALVYKSFDVHDNAKTKDQINAFNANMKGVMLNMNYKITEHTFINIGLNYSDGGYNPFMQNTGMGGFNAGQHSSMFGW